ncbi:amino acid adenylation domain-containing protein, partial [Variovorax sp. DT-64]|uniref:amino acid adenylation domain-containing protein n=1 Tax=Variovorax sp. DT-64 TaxID=3396160 RepID=UPI003F1AF58B
QLVEALQPERSLGSSPLFQVLFNHQRTDTRALHRLPGLVLEDYALADSSAQFELTLDSSEDESGQVRLAWRYAAELFEAQTIERMARHYVAVLDALAQRPQQAVGDVVLLDDAERAQLRQWGTNAQPHGDAEPVHRLFERQARRTPDATALVFGEEQLSYAELDRRARQLAGHLLARGIGPEVRVAIHAERSCEFVLGVLAVLQAGGTYVPLDPALPAQRLDYQLRDSQAALLLSAGDFAWAPGVPVLRLSLTDRHDAMPLARTATPHPAQAAYVIYTSGSTGRPKGVVVTHGALARYVQAVLARLDLPEAARSMAMVSTVAADLGHTVFYGALCAGRALHLMPAETAFDPEAFAAYMSSRNVDVLKIVPSHLQALLGAQQPARVLPAHLLVLGGEASPWPLIERIGRLSPGTRVLNHYGPTETTVGVLTQEAAEASRDADSLPIGRPLAGCEAHVLDAGLGLVPCGVAGELYLGGAGLARGYQDRGGQTAERFVASPFQHGARLYRSGDRVRMLRDGSLEYLGRMDDQVKVRGYRVELPEVARALRAQPGVREAVVVAREGRLVAYVSAQAGQVLDTARLREQLGRALPDYMVPGGIVVLETLPLNANGKVDRKALPEPVLDGGAQAYEAPQGETEEVLARIWSEVLGVARVGRHDNFFELGGHSLLSLQLLERVRRQGFAAQARTLFEQPRLAAFAQALASEASRPEVVVPPNGIPPGCTTLEPSMLTLVVLDADQVRRIEAAVPGGAANIQDIYPLAPLQEGILFHHRLQAQGDAYVGSQALGFDSRERLERFVHSLERVIARHDILRTAVLWEGLDEPVQVVCRQAPLRLQWLQGETSGDGDGEAGGDVAEQLAARVHPAHYRIDVRQAPMIHAVAAHDAARQRWLLQLPSHHLVLDHITLELVVREIALFEAGREEALPEPVPFRRFVAQARLGVSRA